MKKFHKKIRWKLILVLMLFLVGISLLLTLQQAFSQKKMLQEAFEQQRALMRENVLLQAKNHLGTLELQLENELAAYNFSKLVELVTLDTAQSRDVDYAYVVDRRGRVVVHTADTALVNTKMSFDEIEGETIRVNEMSSGKDPVLLVSKTLHFGTTPWGVLSLAFPTSELEEKIALYKSEMENKADNAILGSFFAMLLFLLIALPLVYGMARRLSDPIVLLTQRAEQLSSGVFQELYNPGPTRDDEIGVLARTFDTMSRNLSNSYRKLEEYNTQLEQMVQERTMELEQKNIALLKQSRLVQMGEMIEQIAHQWRQPLNNMALLMQDLFIKTKIHGYNDEKFEEVTERMNENLQYMSKTIDDFRNFHAVDKVVEVFAIEEVTRMALTLSDATLQYANVTCEVVSDEEHHIEAAKNETIQIFMNLLKNARDAIVESAQKQGRITISIGGDGQSVRVDVEDNGGGIPDDVIDHIFDPYFTTKEGSKGSGIGLYMSKNIIEESMHGTIWAENVSGGARFTIIIPMLDGR